MGTRCLKRLITCYFAEQKEQAIEIYALGIRGKGRDPGAAQLSEKYGVSPKAIRDIW
jgi:hypothetical protein